MTLRSLMTLILIFVVVSLGLWVAWLNQDMVTFRLPGRTPLEFETRLWVVSFLSLLVGVFVALLYTVVLSSKEALARYRSRRTERQSSVHNRLLIEGLRSGLRGEKRKALGQFEDILAEDPENIDAWLEAGHTSRHLGNVDKALDLHMRARALNPDDPRVQEALAADFEALGEYGRAVNHVEQLIASMAKPDPRLYAWLRDLLARAGKWDEAARTQDKRLKLLKDGALRTDEETILRGLRFERGQALLASGEEDKRKEAVKIFEGLIKADAQFVPGYLLLGDARLAAGNADGAEKAWEAGVDTTHSLPLLDHLIQHYLNSGEPESAIQTYRKAADTIEGGDSAAARLGLGLLYARLEMLDEARAEFEALADRSEYSPALQFYLGRLQKRLGDETAAAEMFEEIIRQSGILQPTFRCTHCGASYDDYMVRCLECGRWGTIVQDISRAVRVVEERGLRAPRP